MMERLLSHPDFKIQAVEENGITMHLMSMTFRDESPPVTLNDLYTLGELEQLEYELIDILFAIAKHRKRFQDEY